MKKSSEKKLELFFERNQKLIYLKDNIYEAVETIVWAYNNGCTLLVCGNGGSASDSLHIVGELMKSFTMKRPLKTEIKQALYKEYPEEAKFYIENLESALPAISLVSETSLLTAYMNDNVGDLIYAQQIIGYGKPGAVLLAISTSGQSKNIVHATRVAKAIGMTVVSLTGITGGDLKEFSDILINVPSMITYEIQEYHLPIYHIICLLVENEFFGKEV